MTFAALDAEAKLSAMEDKEAARIELHRPTFRNLFTRVINYVNYNAHIKEFSLSPIHQTIVFDPQGPFEILIGGKPTKIQSKTSMIGDFTKEQLLKLLNKSIIEGNICCVVNENHAIRLAYKNSQWILYDPNYDHAAVETIKFVTDSKEKLVDEIFKIMGDSLGVVVSSLNNKQLLDFDEKILFENPKELLKRDKTFILFLDLASKEHIAYLFKRAQANAELRDFILEKLVKMDGAVLSRRLVESPNTFAEFINLVAMKDSKLNDQIFQNLFIHFTLNSEALARVVVQSHDAMNAIFAVALSKSGYFFKSHISSIVEINQNFIKKIIAENPSNLANLFKCIDSKPSAAKIAGIQNNIQKAIETTEGLDLFLKALAYKQDKHTTVWHLITKSSKPSRKIIIDSLTARFKTLTNDELLKFGEDIRRACYAHETPNPYHDMCLERHRLYRRSEYGKTSLWQALLKSIQECLKDREFKETELNAVKQIQSESVLR
ncbi:MAG: hypothetical protein ACYCQI_15280 [Gammaproteobacteria bacterium]